MHRISFKALNVLTSLLAMACLVSSARAAISVGPDGAGPLTFDTEPTGGDFLSAYYQGVGATFLTVADMDAAIADLASTDLLPNFVLATASTVPPNPYAYAFRHNTTGLFLQSRPTTVSGTGPNSAGIVMMATLLNDTGVDQSSIVLGYDMEVSSPAAGELPGYRVYFSVTGDAGSWQVIPELSGVETTGPMSAALNLDSWPSGSQMYLLWFDDNADGVADPGYTIDNMTITIETGPKVPVSITQQTNLTDRTVLERQPLIYSISATGNPIQYQWFHDGVPMENGTNCDNGHGHDRIITGARSATLRINSVEPLDSGNYQCVVSNLLNSESSVVATLTVTPDTTAPTILYAYPGANLNEIIVVFSEPMNDSCLGVGGGGAVTEAINWLVEDVGGSGLGVASFTNATDFRGQTTLGLMTFSPHDPALPLRVTMQQPLFDTAVAQNVMTAGTYRVVTPLVPLDQIWSYDDQDIDPGPNWFATDPAGAFPTGPGPFDAKRDGGILHANGLDDCRANTLYELGAVGTCLSLQSPITLTNLITAYFWTQFNFAGDRNNSDLFFIGKADDGAVVYLNGTELQRIRMPAAPTEITHSTFSTGIVGDPDPRDRILIAHPPELQAGDNLLALSLHQQASLTSSDLTMGYQVYAIEPTSVARVSVTVSGGHPVISWTPAGGQLEFKDNLADPTWAQLSTTNPFTDTSGQPHRFYRVFFP
ncbi:MAG TPA: immunoglobulin domain-containing protein [Verrucomicrobiae bacterium]|nr:immunoglobulin domain-containing protein [Verrucomicrobiae bacterium]